MRKPNALFDKINDATEAKAIAEAEADIAAGNFVPHVDVIRWVKSWFTPNELPCPKPKKQ